VRDSYHRQAAVNQWVVIDGEQSKDAIAAEVFTVAGSRLGLP
jgi:thymidylate kinase